MFEVAHPGYTSRRAAWDPKEDITAYELALNLPIFARASGMSVDDFLSLIDNLPDNASRHWNRK